MKDTVWKILMFVVLFIILALFAKYLLPAMIQGDHRPSTILAPEE